MNAETTLARALDDNDARARDEAFALIREALTISATSAPAPASMTPSAQARPWVADGLNRTTDKTTSRAVPHHFFTRVYGAARRRQGLCG
jgi:hypothetical protein